MDGFYWHNTYWHIEYKYWHSTYWHIKSAIAGFLIFSALRVRATVNANLIVR